MKMKIVVLALGLILLVAVGLFGCGASKELTEVSVNRDSPKLQKLKPIDENGYVDDSTDSDDTSTNELIALADTREEAEEIAKLYGIELSTYSYGVATYTTDKNVTELMQLGEEKGYPELSLNHKQELFTEQETN